MAENNEIKSQRLSAIEKFAGEVQASRNDWLNDKANAATSKKVYDKNADALLLMIAEKSDTPLLDENDDED